MNSKIRPVLEILPMLLYLLACVACSAYLLYSFMALFVQQAMVMVPIGPVAMF